ncbi:HAD family hydrolase [Lujinxingia vulgaris]|uniref:HAD family hydrolase n=1 Tax=Lujinxingia vulgaris TaxID=2600176 RepID=A0A5C6X6Y4_9DELT|nr:haloacid dehalogenase-like hydrolase [Lujinxingia vulgaris]TXD37024.1 HAD family hydrolase [Lujinxingia vulgaris]
MQEGGVGRGFLGSFAEPIARRLGEVIEGGAGEVAVFDFDNTCIVGDIGELFSHYLIEAMGYRYDLEAFWELVHPEEGRAELRGLSQGLLGVGAEVRGEDPRFESYLAEMGALYGRRLERLGKRACYEWAVRLHVGLTPGEMARFTAEAIEAELGRPLSDEVRRTARGEEVRIARGVRVIAEVRRLMEALSEAGVEVWVVSATNIWTVRVFAELLGVPAERVIGNRVELEGDRLSSRTSPPVLFREGKVEAIEQVIGRQPILAVGDADTDFEMLCHARHALVMDKGDALLRREGPSRGFMMQSRDALSLEAPEVALEMLRRRLGVDDDAKDEVGR